MCEKILGSLFSEKYLLQCPIGSICPRDYDGVLSLVLGKCDTVPCRLPKLEEMIKYVKNMLFRVLLWYKKKKRKES